MRRSVLLGLGSGLLVVAVGLGIAVVALGADDDADDDRAGQTTSAPGPSSPSTGAGTTSTTGAPPTAAPTSTTTPLRSFTIAATGDFLIHTTVSSQALTYGGGSAYDFSPMLADVTPILEAADLAICHVEVPLSADDSDLSGYPVFSAPHELAPAIADAGYDTCSTVSNHALDRGPTGVQSTLDALDAAGVRHAGSARTAEEGSTPNLLDAGGVQVAHLAYTYGLNGFGVPADMPWLVNLIDPARILADAAAARAAGAEFVVVSLQWGAEYQQTPTGDQQALAQTLLASPGVDLIIGHHVHVVQPLGRVGEEVVAYGLGNFLSNQSPDAGLLASTQDGVILDLTVTETSPGVFAVTETRFTPTFVDRANGYVIRPVDAVSNPASYERTVAAMKALGTPGVEPDR